jgi:hypothetical protein
VVGVLQRVLMLAGTAVMSAGGWFGYQTMAGDEALTLDEIMALVDWDSVSSMISSALGG